jgi:hypothetical protein
VLKQNKDFLLTGERPMPSRAGSAHSLAMVELVALPGEGAIGEHAHEDHHESTHGSVSFAGLTLGIGNVRLRQRFGAKLKQDLRPADAADTTREGRRH